MPPLWAGRFTSPLRDAGAVAVEEHSRANAALWAEAEAFLGGLMARRSEREAAETAAATAIQTVFRGWRWRRFIARERKKADVRARIKARVKFLNKSMNMVIEERERAARLLEMRKRAVLRVQGARASAGGRRRGDRTTRVRAQAWRAGSLQIARA